MLMLQLSHKLQFTPSAALQASVIARKGWGERK